MAVAVALGGMIVVVVAQIVATEGAVLLTNWSAAVGELVSLPVNKDSSPYDEDEVASEGSGCIREYLAETTDCGSA